MKYFILAAALLGTACSSKEQTSASSTQSEKLVEVVCPVHSASDISMWINAMPGPNDNPTLMSRFKVVAPSPEYGFSLEILEVKESYPPQYVFELTATPPDGVVAQVETITQVAIDIPNFAYDTIASATVKCGETILFAVESVETAY